MVDRDFAQAIEQYHRAVDAFVTGDAEPQKMMYSRRDDVTLANPIAPPVRGWNEVEAAMDHAASQVRDGEPGRYEQIAAYSTADMGYVVEIQHTRARFGGGTEIGSISLRVTSIFRREDGEWRVIHRHADPLAPLRPVESLVQG